VAPEFAEEVYAVSAEAKAIGCSSTGFRPRYDKKSSRDGKASVRRSTRGILGNSPFIICLSTPFRTAFTLEGRKCKRFSTQLIFTYPHQPCRKTNEPNRPVDDTRPETALRFCSDRALLVRRLRPRVVDAVLQARKPKYADHYFVGDDVARCAVDAERSGELRSW
jgi:hypothetical protein